MRALLILALLAGSAGAAPTQVAVDVADGAPLALAEPLGARLAQDGFAVVPLAARPAIVLTISVHEDELVVAVTSPHFARSRAIDRRDATGAELELELAQKAVELARLAAEAIPPPPRADRELPANLVAAVEPPREARPRWAVGVDGGIVSRGGGTAMGIAVAARVALLDHLGVVAAASLTPSSGSAVTVREVAALLGASGRYELGHGLGVELAVLAGVRDHHFAVAMPVAERTGNLFDAALAARGRIGWSPTPALELSVWGGAGLSRARSHLLGAQVLWHADALELGSGIGVAARF